MDDLRNAMKKYGELTKEISESINKDDYDKLGGLLDKREAVINYVNTLKYSTEEFKSIYEEICLSSSEEELNSTANKKMLELKKNIDMVIKGKNVNKIYGKKLDVDPMFFSKRL